MEAKETEAPILTRIEISRREYDAIRKQAIDERISTANLLGQLVREGSARKPKGKT